MRYLLLLALANCFTGATPASAVSNNACEPVVRIEHVDREVERVVDRVLRVVRPCLHREPPVEPVLIGDLRVDYARLEDYARRSRAWSDLAWSACRIEK